MIIKSKTEILLAIKSLVVNNETGIITINMELRNPRFNPASLFEAKFLIGGEWFPMTLADSQPVDLDNIPLSGRPKTIPINWDGAKDLRVMSSFPNIPAYVIFNDRASLGGQNTEPYFFNIPLVDFRVTDIKSLIYPYANDPYFQIKFINRATIRPSKMHFVIEVATDRDFNNILKTFDSSESLTGWAVNGEPMPEVGVEGGRENEVLFQSDELESLPEANYYLRITPVVFQFYATINEPYNGQVFVGSQVDILGSVVIIDTE